MLTDIHILSRASLSVQMVAQSQVEDSTAQSFCGIPNQNSYRRNSRSSLRRSYDGIINIQDIVLIAASFGEVTESEADLNGDGVVNIQDLVIIANALGNAAGVSTYARAGEQLTAAQGNVVAPRQA